MRYFAISDEMGTMWIDAETSEEAHRIAEEETDGKYNINEITKEEYDSILREFYLDKQIRDELEKDYDIGNMPIREYNKLFQKRKAEILGQTSK